MEPLSQPAMETTAPTGAPSAPNGRRHTPGQGREPPRVPAVAGASTAALTPPTVVAVPAGPQGSAVSGLTVSSGVSSATATATATAAAPVVATAAEAASPASASSKRSADDSPEQPPAKRPPDFNAPHCDNDSLYSNDDENRWFAEEENVLAMAAEQNRQEGINADAQGLADPTPNISSLDHEIGEMAAAAETPEVEYQTDDVTSSWTLESRRVFGTACL